jgi:hypothetical protein
MRATFTGRVIEWILIGSKNNSHQMKGGYEMKCKVAVMVGMACIFLSSHMAVQAADLTQTLKGVTQTLTGGEQQAPKADEQAKEAVDASKASAPGENAPGAAEKPDDSQTSSGLKEALSIGIQEAVKLAGAENGFYKNAAIKITLPESLQKADQMIRQFGGEQLSETLVEKMNRAAEKAAPQAQEIFLQAIKDLQFSDVTGILSGNDTAATVYLKEKTSESLSTAFYPIIKSTMQEINGVKTYDDYIGKLASNPMMKMGGMDLDISQHVTDKAMEGLFHLVGEQEKNIREVPAARVTDLLKTVFGGK